MSDEKSEIRMIKCAKLGIELPAMIYKPFSGEFGETLYAEISQQAWNMWLEHSKMLVNEYRLDLTSEEAHATLKSQCREFLYGDGEAGAPPPDFVPAER